eukprot:TRINITY_DN6057_c0_g1_i1.p1 TRINITY_DN6057_c0_g1~~TRINITY_DN6057_c0_g1_i1.p1  ORF type:complete len:802 (+),score=114.45 TRINITY_DN6057_c0_g1_i1:30-2408(+)
MAGVASVAPTENSASLQTPQQARHVEAAFECTPLRRCRRKTKDSSWTGTPSSSPQAVSPPTLLKRGRCSSASAGAGTKRRAGCRFVSAASHLSSSLRVLPPFGWSALENTPPAGTQQPPRREPRSAEEVLLELLSEARSLADEAAARSCKRRASETVGGVSSTPRAQLDTGGRARRRVILASSPPPELQGIASRQPALNVQSIREKVSMRSTEPASTPEPEQAGFPPITPAASSGDQLVQHRHAQKVVQAASSSLPHPVIPHAAADELWPQHRQAGPETAAVSGQEVELERAGSATTSPARRAAASVPSLVLVAQDHAKTASAPVAEQHMRQGSPAIREANSSSSSSSSSSSRSPQPALASASVTPKSMPERREPPPRGASKSSQVMRRMELTSSVPSPRTHVARPVTRPVRRVPQRSQDQIALRRGETADDVLTTESAEQVPALNLLRNQAGPTQNPTPELRNADLYASDFEDEEPVVVHQVHRQQLPRPDTPEAWKSERLDISELEESVELQMVLESSIKGHGFQSRSGSEALSAACPTCGKTYVPQNSRFCRHCGQKRAAEAQSVQLQQGHSPAASAGPVLAQDCIFESPAMRPAANSTKGSLSSPSSSGAGRATASSRPARPGSAESAGLAPVQSRLLQQPAAQPEASSTPEYVFSPSFSGERGMATSHRAGSATSNGEAPKQGRLHEPPVVQSRAGFPQGTVSSRSLSRAAHTTALPRRGAVTRIASIHSADVLGDAERLDQAALSRARVRRDEGTRGRMVGFDGQELSRSQGSAFSAGARYSTDVG